MALGLVELWRVKDVQMDSTMYQDYPISRELLRWESQSQQSQTSVTGQNLIHHLEQRYMMLFFGMRLRVHAGKDVSPLSHPM